MTTSKNLIFFAYHYQSKKAFYDSSLFTYYYYYYLLLIMILRYGQHGFLFQFYSRSKVSCHTKTVIRISGKSLLIFLCLVHTHTLSVLFPPYPTLCSSPKAFAHVSREPPDVFDRRWAKGRRHVASQECCLTLATPRFIHTHEYLWGHSTNLRRSLNLTLDIHPNHYVTELLLLCWIQTATSGRTK